jgi:hypothetical protein
MVKISMVIFARETGWIIGMSDLAGMGKAKEG